MIKMKDGNIEYEWYGDEILIKGKRFISSSLFEIGLAVESQAKSLAPIDSGMLKNSISTQSKTEGSNTGEGIIKKPVDENIVLVGTAVEYAPYQEYGTKTMDAQPFLRPALDMVQGKAVTLIQKNGKFEFKEYMKP